MVRGSAEPWAEMLAASSAGAAGLRSSSRLHVLGQSSVAVINLSITRDHPACQTPPRPGPSPAPMAPGERESKREKLSASNEQRGPHPLPPDRLGWCQGLGSFPAGGTQKPSAREILPARGWQTAHHSKAVSAPCLAF